MESIARNEGPGWEMEAAEEQRQLALVEEARAIVAGRSILLPSREHLAALLAWLDGRRGASEGVRWNGAGVPF